MLRIGKFRIFIDNMTRKPAQMIWTGFKAMTDVIYFHQYDLL